MRTRFHTCDAYVESVTPTIEDFYCEGKWVLRRVLARYLYGGYVDVILYNDRAFFNSRKTTSNVMRYIRETTGSEVSARYVKDELEGACLDGCYITESSYGTKLDTPLLLIGDCNEASVSPLSDILYYYHLEV